MDQMEEEHIFNSNELKNNIDRLLEKVKQLKEDKEQLKAKNEALKLEAFKLDLQLHGMSSSKSREDKASFFHMNDQKSSMVKNTDLRELDGLCYLPLTNDRFIEKQSSLQVSIVQHSIGQSSPRNRNDYASLAMKSSVNPYKSKSPVENKSQGKFKNGFDRLKLIDNSPESPFRHIFADND